MITGRILGKSGEDFAASYLISLGWHILARNSYERGGEIDILADTGKMLAVIEVKAKSSSLHGEPIEMVTARKQQKLRRLAKRVEQAYNKPVRIDVIAIHVNKSGTMQLQHIPFAVGE